MPAPPGGSRYYIGEDELRYRSPSSGIAVAGPSTHARVESREASQGPVSAMGHIGSLSSNADDRNDQNLAPSFPPEEFGRQGVGDASSAILPPPLSHNDLFPHTRHGAAELTSNASGSPNHSNTQGGSVGSGHDRKRRRGTNASDSLGATLLRNPVDALELLSQAAAERDVDKEEGSSIRATQFAQTDNNGDERSGGERRPPAASTSGSPPARLEDFPLVKSGVMSGRKLCDLISDFFSRCHFIYPGTSHPLNLR